ncbi:MAG: DUF4180 domain-containing protein [Cytophagia bacterium]|nr:DUF4180 domain-containing protein [Cytophagia bacterium]
MHIELHQFKDKEIAELNSDVLIISDIDSGTDLLGNLYYQGVGRVIIHKYNITPEFFDLKTKIAGEILQKFSNYQVRLAIVGDFNEVESKSLRDFIRESNRGKLVNFVDSLNEALMKLSN